MTNEELDIEVKRLRLEPGDRVVFTVDVGNMPSAKAQEKMEHLRQRLNDSKFLPEDTKILVVDKRIDISVISPSQED
ncbi:MAG: hypothetical protein LC687_03715 [Actinobacteria bacterium]|nr:hypothetical protein [Actinomycetota bacterium]